MSEGKITNVLGGRRKDALSVFLIFRIEERQVKESGSFV